jgi:hypothetical protein
LKFTSRSMPKLRPSVNSRNLNGSSSNNKTKFSRVYTKGDETAVSSPFFIFT